MILSRHERLTEMLRLLEQSAPFSTGHEARAALERIMREVEDEYSGIPEDPSAHVATTSDGRMYPPHRRFEFAHKCPRITAFRQKGHRTLFGDNGALRIERVSDGNPDVDLPGFDGKKIDDLLVENEREPNRTVAGSPQESISESCRNPNQPN